jgi:hypothetical protein
MAATPRPNPPDVTIKITLPAPMAWRLDEVAEETYGIEDHQLALLLIAKGLRKPRGPQTDLSRDWEIYQLWRTGLATSQIGRTLRVAARTVSTRLTSMGLRSRYEDYRKSNASVISQKGWETRRAKRAALQEQAERAQLQTEEQLSGEADRKAAEARAKAAERRRKNEREEAA